jgi:purine-binding chemotaxis protein CheW
MTDAILDARTEALARPIERARTARLPHLLVMVAGEQYAFATDAVRAVAEIRRITALPHTPPQVLGLTSRGGTVLPVFDLRAILELPLVVLPEHGRIIVVGREIDELAVVVDTVEGTQEIGDGDVAPLPPTVVGPVRSLARGILENGIVVLSAELVLESVLFVVDSPLPR